ncbi:heme utilization cystosolic carrier protein HutX [Vibrio rumoiensis]|uniref:HuvX protein n=1 Tax=Vibrio rumoiensis 1S-45 TaxID=1188252 RepID=A0A1E5E504_9VIBR|nr:heme utilization cystosolic carrier protein HutX [Vibrio rumoiensis]OEF27610.1 HuvX protein [Vibrio rumoiensis 1S-45]
MEKIDLKQMVINAVTQDPSILPAALAEKLQVSEGEVVSLLPEEMAVVVNGEHIQGILEQLPEWGPVTSIIHSFGSIFEVKAPFPKGKVAHGYYNLMGRDGELHGHLKLDLMDKLALVSKPFRGKESYYFGFFDAQGNSIFKIYLGRDNKRVLLSDQVEKFKALQLAFTQ